MQYALTAALSSLNAAYFLGRPWPNGRLRFGAWTLALVCLGVALQSVYIAVAGLPGRPLTAAEARGWLLAGAGGLLGSALVAGLVLRRHLRR
jgi:hypothetical protein